ncbi:phosphatase PAP2 family protein [Caenimonas terrae]|uniref:Phosphatase PAP2 family protein n=1 Tax=Caenimonas terrae TaxID=696074 RepID=A0ABW0NEN5_9BURK
MRHPQLAQVASCATLLLASTFATHVGAQVVAKTDRFGDAMEILLPAAAAALTLERGDVQGLKEFALSGALAVGTTEVLKRAVNSPRPDGSSGGFPSAHTSIAFVSAAYVHQRYGAQWAMPMYGLATLAGYSRVRSHAHFTKDVLGGALIGISSAFFLTHPLSARTQATVGMEGRTLQVIIRSQL